MGIAPGAVLHVGDHTLEDVEGAGAVGMQALLLERGPRRGADSLGRLDELPGRLTLGAGPCAPERR